jgi:tetratricopeptide (TPR) repeat protein
MMRAMPIRTLTCTLLAALALAGCTLTRPAPFTPPPAATPNAAGSAQPAPGIPAPGGAEALPAPPERPSVPPPRQFRLNAASGALVAQAHAQAAGGDYAQAAATLERAQRIEPDNPLLWIELGRVRLAENNAPQADAMGRKALALAVGDPAAQSAAWHLIADSLKARGRNGEAAEAEQKAQGMASRQG